MDLLHRLRLLALEHAANKITDDQFRLYVISMLCSTSTTPRMVALVLRAAFLECNPRGLVNEAQED